MKNYVQKGDNITVTATTAATSGEGVLIGNLFGIAAGTVEVGDLLDLATTGVFRMAKVNTDAFSVGAPVYFDEATNLVTTDDDSGNNFEIGVAITTSGNPSGAVSVRLHG